ncbi:Transketolase, thiamine diphosphate binding domain [Musa troglodytarum]|uniref:Transketolase, thiamine diphosphate binding domain n=1 Tax=Musa troglodytarum TaxID=320322 RepID=A0A9E7EJ91_9LILI|nr:Transketolase, thiamine diphosphate binding domain [Musa troglodytarum]
MAAISNGIALHGSRLISFAATFLAFSDDMKNSIRLSALSHAGVLYVFTHDSIGHGEDRPTQQPEEQLAGLRAIPRMLVFRPADGNEIAGAYKAAIANRTAPSAMALSRQKVAANLEASSASDVARGGYVISDNSGGAEEGGATCESSLACVLETVRRPAEGVQGVCVATTSEETGERGGGIAHWMAGARRRRRDRAELIWLLLSGSTDSPRTTSPGKHGH